MFGAGPPVIEPFVTSPPREVLYKQLGNLRLLRRESWVRTAGNSDVPTQDFLRKAPLVPSPLEDQFPPSLKQVHIKTMHLSFEQGPLGLCSGPQVRPLVSAAATLAAQ